MILIGLREFEIRADRRQHKEENTTDYLFGVIGLSCHRMEDRSATSRQGFLHEVA